MGDQTDHQTPTPRRPRQPRRRAPKPEVRGLPAAEPMLDEYNFPLTSGREGVAEAAARIQVMRDREYQWTYRTSLRRSYLRDPTEKAKVRTKRRCVMRVAASDGEILTFPHQAGLEGELLHVLRFDESAGVWWRCRMHVEAGPDVLLCRAEAMEVTAPGNGRDVSVEIPGRAEDYSLLDGERDDESAPEE